MSAASAAEERNLLDKARTVGNLTFCNPVNAARKAPKGNARTVRPHHKYALPQIADECVRHLMKELWPRQLMMAITAAPMDDYAQERKGIGENRLLAVRSSTASNSATNLPIAVCKPRSSRLIYALHCRINTQALYSAGAMRCKRRGGKTNATSIETLALAMFEAEP